jgi:hypothetical protein
MIAEEEKGRMGMGDVLQNLFKAGRQNGRFHRQFWLLITIRKKSPHTKPYLYVFLF